MRNRILFAVLIGFFQIDGNAQTINHPAYIGVLTGYGSTTWNGLVPRESNLNSAISLSTPINVSEGGAVWGLVTGLEFTPTFALELSYMHYPDANVAFDGMSLFTFENDGLKNFETHSETVSIIGKIMTPVFNTKVRVFSSFGAANLHRRDIVIDEWRITPTFGVGFNYLFGDRFLAEVVGNYTAGFGESRISPTDSFYPFLYSVSLRMAYCF